MENPKWDESLYQEELDDFENPKEYKEELSELDKAWSLLSESEKEAMFPTVLRALGGRTQESANIEEHLLQEWKKNNPDKVYVYKFKEPTKELKEEELRSAPVRSAFKVVKKPEGL